MFLALPCFSLSDQDQTSPSFSGIVLALKIRVVLGVLRSWNLFVLAGLSLLPSKSRVQYESVFKLLCECDSTAGALLSLPSCTTASHEKN